MNGEDLIRAGVISVASGPLKADVGNSAVLLDFASPEQARAFANLIAKAAFDWPDTGPAEAPKPNTLLRMTYRGEAFRPVTSDEAQALKDIMKRTSPVSVSLGSSQKGESR